MKAKWTPTPHLATFPVRNHWIIRQWWERKGSKKKAGAWHPLGWRPDGDTAPPDYHNPPTLELGAK